MWKGTTGVKTWTRKGVMWLLKFLPVAPSPFTPAEARKAERLGARMTQERRVWAGRSGNKSDGEGSWNSQENQSHEADTPGVTEGGFKKLSRRTQQGGEAQPGIGVGSRHLATHLTTFLTLQAHAPLSTPPAHPRALAHDALLLFQPLFTPFTPTLSATTSSSTELDVSPRYMLLLHHVTFTSASDSGHFAFL